MRARQVLLLSFLCLPLFAQSGSETLEFDVTVEAGERAPRGSGVLLPITVSIPVDQLQFAQEETEQVAKVSIFAESGKSAQAVLERHRVPAPLNTEPQGAVTRRFTQLAPESTITITVVDEVTQRRGTRTIVLDGTAARVQPQVESGAADAAWREALARAVREKKPLVVFFRTTPCARCGEFERTAISHPAIERRMSSVVFVVLPATEGRGSLRWASRDPGVAMFDRTGRLRLRWPIIPDTTNFGIILDSVIAVAPSFERAVQLTLAGSPEEGDLEAASALARLGRFKDAREALGRARASRNAETRETAMIANALIDANEGNAATMLAELEQLATNASTPKIASEAWIAIGAIQRASGAHEKAIRAYTSAFELLEDGSAEAAAVQRTLATLRARQTARAGAIRILPLGQQVVSGKQTVRTNVATAAIANVAFSLDGREVITVRRPPFSTTLDFGTVPERRVISVAAFDRNGAEIGRDTRVVNEGGETFWLRMMSPREGFVSGSTRVSLNLRAPAARRVRRVVLSWNDATRRVLTSAPWETNVDIPAGQVGVLRAVAELEDGRTVEDAVLLNAGGMTGRADVQLFELPITIMSRHGSLPSITADRIKVREGRRSRVVESVASAAETPLTVGLLMDVSGSMQRSLPDLQEAAIRFLQTILGEGDRAFLITFDSRAQLLQPPTANVELLRDQIMKVRPGGQTALHDAMALGLLQFEGIKGRRAMVLFTDGADVTSEYTAAEVNELARRVSVPVHVFATRPTGMHGAFAVAQLTSGLRRIAQATGGTSHTLQDLEELPGVYARIEAALRAQVLAFVRTDPATRDNEWRSIDVSVTGEGFDVYAPEGYYASW